MEILIGIHSMVRWLIVIVSIAAVFRFAYGWLGKKKFGGIDRGLLGGFSGLVDLQLLIGVVILIWMGVEGSGFPRFQLDHAFVLFVAAVFIHLPFRWKNAADTVRFRNSFLSICLALVLIYWGVVRIGGWNF